MLALTPFNDGTGEALHIGGEFTTAGGLPASRIAAWNGTTWGTLSTGMDSVVQDLAPFDDGTGASLYAVGSFNTAGGSSSLNIAKWVTCPPPCPADLDGDGLVAVPDLLALLAAWGTNPGGPPDFDGDGAVAVPDLLTLLASWGPCP